MGKYAKSQTGKAGHVLTTAPSVLFFMYFYTIWSNEFPITVRKKRCLDQTQRVHHHPTMVGHGSHSSKRYNVNYGTVL